MAEQKWHGRAKRMRKERGMTYQAIADELGKSWNAVYLAVNPTKRPTYTKLGERRTIYVDDELWFALETFARKASVSRSKFIVEVLEGSRRSPGLPEVGSTQ